MSKANTSGKFVNDLALANESMALPLVVVAEETKQAARKVIAGHLAVDQGLGEVLDMLGLSA